MMQPADVMLPANHGLHYSDAEIALIYQAKRSPAAKQQIAQMLNRKPSAIALVWRWCDGANFPEEANNLIRRQVARCRRTLGEETRGVVDPAELRPPGPDGPSVEDAE